MKKKESKKYTFNYFLDIVSDAFITVIKKLNKFLTDKKKGVVVKVIVRFICCLLLISILGIPFFVLGNIGEGIIYLCGTTFKEGVIVIWKNLVQYAYILFTLVILFKVIYNMSKRKEFSLEINGSKQIGNNLYYAVQVFLKIIIVISIIPIILFEILLFASLGMLIAFITHGIYFFGPFLIIIGLIIMGSTILSYIFNSTVIEKGGSK